MSRQFTRDYFLEVSRGNIAGQRIMRGLGEREAVGVSVNGEDLTKMNDLSAVPSAPASDIFIPWPVDAGEQLTVISEDDADNGAGATGALTIVVEYLDASGNEQQETVTMNGTTAVDLNETNVRFVQDMYVKTVGSNNVAEGNIRIYEKADDTQVYNMIEEGGNKSLVPHRMVPLNKSLHLIQWSAGEGNGTRSSVRLRADCSAQGVRQQGVFLFKSILYLKASANTMPLGYIIPALSMLKVSAWVGVGGGGAYLNCHWWGVLIDD